MTKHHLILLSFLLQSLFLNAQNCADENLCAEDGPYSASMDAPSPITFNCLDVDYSYIFAFTTNNDGDATNATITIENIDCGDPVVPADTIFALVVEPGPGDPCDLSQSNVVESCQSDSISMTIELTNLFPQTTYHLVIGANVEGCGFETSISGEAVGINVCCDTEVGLGLSYTVEELSGADEYTWDPLSYIDDTDAENPTITPEQSVQYTVTAEVGGCTVTDELFITLLPPVVPANMFTPNGDMINDLWIIEGINRFQGATVTVFDRWGQVVFKSIGYAQPWDGTNRGKELPSATYYYVIEINSLNVDAEPITGSITIVK